MIDYMAHKETRSLIKLGESIVLSLPSSWIRYNDAKPGDKVEIITYGTTAEIKLLSNNNQPKGEKEAEVGKER